MGFGPLMCCGAWCASTLRNVALNDSSVIGQFSSGVCLLGISRILASQSEFGKRTSSFWKGLRRMGFILLDLQVQPSGPGLPAPALVGGLFRRPVSSRFSPGRLCVSRDLSTSSSFPFVGT